MPAVRPSFDEVVALARAIVADPRAPLPPVTSSVLEAAAKKVVRELDDYDRALFKRLTGPDAEPESRHAVERALAQRISNSVVEHRADLAELIDHVRSSDSPEH